MDKLNYVKNHWVPIDYTNLLKILEYTLLFQMVLNIILVKLGARQATLIEINNLESLGETKNIYEKILNVIIKKMNMVKTRDIVSYRYFVTNKKIKGPTTDEEIGKLLGFECVGHDYHLQDVPRVSFSIYEQNTDENIYTEVCEKDKIEDLDEMIRKQEAKVKLWNEIISGVIPYEFQLEIKELLPSRDLYNNYENKHYVIENIAEYLNLIYNDFYNESQFLNKDFLLANFNVFKFIMKHLGDIDILYNMPSNRYPSEGFNSLIKNVAAFEKKLLKAKNEKEMMLYLGKLIDIENKHIGGKRKSKRKSKRKYKRKSKKTRK